MLRRTVPRPSRRPIPRRMLRKSRPCRRTVRSRRMMEPVIGAMAGEAAAAAGARHLRHPHPPAVPRKAGETREIPAAHWAPRCGLVKMPHLKA
jgi:hypothetical protein